MAKTRRKGRKKRTITLRRKVFKVYGEGLKYMIFDGKHHVFKYVGTL